MNCNITTTFTSLCFSAALAASALAGTIHVPAEHLTIQEAIVAAESGDAIIVAPGTYNEAINFNGKTLTLRSSAGPSRTTIDATGLNLPVVRIVSGEGEGTTLEGFTITGGSPSGSTGGGGIRVTSGSNLLVIDCIITGNSAAHAGGVACSGANATLVNCVISENTAIGAGGGMRVSNGASVVMEDCTVTGNTAASNAGIDSGGGGIQVNTNSTLLMTGCIISENSSLAAGGGIRNGGGIAAADGCSVTLNNCIVHANTAARGGGLSSNGSDADLIDSTFTNNTASGPGSSTVDGGAISHTGGSLTAINCEFTANTVDGGGNSFNARGGGAVFLSAVTAAFTACHFTENACLGANESGGAVYVANGGGTQTTLAGCSFTGNTSTSWGGAVYEFGNTVLTIENCTFHANQCILGGAGVSAHGLLNVTASSFSNNFTQGNAGGALTIGNIPGPHTIADSSFIGNTTGTGQAGAITSGVFVTIVDCHFEDNEANTQGSIGSAGAVSLSGGGVIERSTFLNNIAHSSSGGGVTSSGSSGTLTVRECAFIGNQASAAGGGLRTTTAFSTVVNTVFSGNTTSFSGGGARLADATIINCLFHNNTASSTGGGLHAGHADIINTTFVHNALTAPSGFFPAGGLIVTGGSPIVNSIVRDNSDLQTGEANGPPVITYSNIQGGFAGEGNIDEDPLFVDADGGDYRLTAKSPSVDSGNTTAVPADVFTDLDGNARVVNCIVDMGAYETQDIAGNPADLTGSGSVGVADLLILLAAWGPCPDTGACPADLNCDGAVGVADLLILLANWG